MADGLRDVFRELFPSLRVVTHFGAKGGGGSRLDYILASDPRSLCAVGAAVHAGAVWPFDHLPVLVDFWGADAPVASSPPGFSLRWQRFLARAAAAEASPPQKEAIVREIAACLPAGEDAEGSAEDTFLSRLESSLRHAEQAADRRSDPSLARRLLDRVALALQGAVGHVVSEVEGSVSSRA